MKLHQKESHWYELLIPNELEGKVKEMFNDGYTSAQIFDYLDMEGYEPEYTQLKSDPEIITPQENNGQATMELIEGGMFDQETVMDNSLGVSATGVMDDARDEIEGLLVAAQENGESQERIEYLTQLVIDLKKFLTR